MMQDAIVCSYSRTITGWLVHKFPDDVSIDSSGANNEEIVSVLQLLLPVIEFQSTTQGHFNLGERIKQVSGLKGKKQQLMWLIDLFVHSPLPDAIKDELYGQLKVYVKWRYDATQVAKGYLPFITSFHKSFPRNFRPGTLIKEKINLPVKLSSSERSFVLDAMKLSLALQYRETDPVTFADENELKLFDMGRGLQIALVGMQKQKRLSLESYIGYMAFRNGVPIAYGGGWIWGQRCRIGISIYPDFRKGGSAWLFAQVLRLYYQHFNARHFIVRANQFGKDNHDGLRSGAFWFYYKLGFRPVHHDLIKLAGEEWRKIQEDKSYRSTLKTLRRFTASRLEWKLNPITFPTVDPEAISRRISDMINADYDRSRTRAVQELKSQVKTKLAPVSWSKTKISDHIFQNWCLLLSLIPGLKDWKLKDKKRLVELIGIKDTGKEREHIIGMQRIALFWRSVSGYN